MADNASFVFLVMDDRFGVVSASLVLDEAVADMNSRVLKQHDSDTLTNPGSFRIKRVELGSRKAQKAEAQRDSRTIGDRYAAVDFLVAVEPQ